MRRLSSRGRPVAERGEMRSPAYGLVDAYLARYVAEHGRQPRIVEIQDHLEIEHHLRSSTTTISRAVRRWLGSPAGKTLVAAAQAAQAVAAAAPGTEPPAPMMNPLLTTFEATMRADLTREIESRLRAEAGVAIEASAAAAKEATERADLATRRADLLVRDAEDRREREVAAALSARDAVQSALSEALAALDRLAESAAAERVAWIDKIDRLAAGNAGLAASAAAAEASRQAAVVALAQAEAKLVEASDRATAQYSGLMQTMTARLVALEHALAGAQESLAQKDVGLGAQVDTLARSAMDAFARSEGLLREIQATMAQVETRATAQDKPPRRRRISPQPKERKKA